MSVINSQILAVHQLINVRLCVVSMKALEPNMKLTRNSQVIFIKILLENKTQSTIYQLKLLSLLKQQGRNYVNAVATGNIFGEYFVL